MARILHGRKYDWVYDNIAYCSSDVRALMDNVETTGYTLTSSVSVYPHPAPALGEDDWDPSTHILRWVRREDVDYGEGKRQAECAAFQHFPALSAVAPRFPYVIGPGDYTQRLRFYVENTIKSIPMHIDNLDARLSFIHEKEAGRFLAHLSAQPCGTGKESPSGPINAASGGTASLAEMLAYVTDRTGIKPIITSKGEAGPYNGATSFSLDCQKAESQMGFVFSQLSDWLYGLLDVLIEQITKENTALC